MFINLIKKSFVDVIKNPIITLFLVTYFIIFSMLMSCIGFQKNPLIAYLLLFTSFLFIAIFIAGWLGVIKEIALKDENSTEPRERSYIAIFLENIGLNIIPCVIALIIYIVFLFLFAYGASLIATKLFGNPYELVKEAQASGNAIEYISKLPVDKLIKLYAFPIAFMFSASLCLFVFLYYFPAIVFNTKSDTFLKPFIALKDNFCFLFKHFFMSLGFYLMLCFINLSVMVAKAFIPNHIAIDILYIFYVIYFMSFAVMLICNYYGKNNPCNNGSDCIGEDKGNDNVSEEN